MPTGPQRPTLRYQLLENTVDGLVRMKLRQGTPNWDAGNGPASHISPSGPYRLDRRPGPRIQTPGPSSGRRVLVRWGLGMATGEHGQKLVESPVVAWPGGALVVGLPGVVGLGVLGRRRAASASFVAWMRLSAA